MSTPSIVPNDRLDKDFYLVLEEFGPGPRSGKPTRALITPPSWTICSRDNTTGCSG
jgi:hypothetical protein